MSEWDREESRKERERKAERREREGGKQERKREKSRKERKRRSKATPSLIFPRFLSSELLATFDLTFWEVGHWLKQLLEGEERKREEMERECEIERVERKEEKETFNDHV